MVKLIAQSLGEYLAEEKIVPVVGDEAIPRESLGEYVKDSYQVATAYPSVELPVEVRKLGAGDYLIKPVAPDNLETLIQ